MNRATRLTLSAIFLFACVSASGQVSPGPLSAAHGSLDSPLKCASCHAFGEGTPKLKCQGCHREIRDIVSRKRGYHGRVVDVKKGDLDCARCHTEHLGKNFRIIRWPESKDDFDHRTAGYPLEGRHARLKCEECHTPKHISPAARALISVKDLTRTFMGLNQACLTCHEDRHAGQLGADCRRCHDYSRWKPLVSFDHSKARFPLAGKHADVQCDKCHKPLPDNAKVIQYTGIKFADCSGCHRDPHNGAFAAHCESCHNTNGWRATGVSTAFNHDNTKFPLNGKHNGLACAKCHKSTNFKTPIAHAKCMDCHQDQHKGQFVSRADHGECGSCHTDKGFKPSTFTETAHQSTAFPLLAKHQGLACAKCHTGTGLAINYHPAYKACIDCHKDPHGRQFATAPYQDRCQDCHTVEGFHPSTFTLSRHQSSRFDLKGAHAAVACLDCHRTDSKPDGADRRFHFGTLVCTTCHQDPHRGEFPAVIKASLKPGQDVCESCHELRSWRKLRTFDHATTQFELAGVHGTLACVDCHRPRAADAGAREIPFKTAPERCVGCHEDIHAGQFDRESGPAECSSCHIQTRWAAARFDHEHNTSFSLNGAHANVPCRLCHLSRDGGSGRRLVVYKGTPRECRACHQ